MPKLNTAVDALSMPAIPKVQAWARAYDGSHGPTSPKPFPDTRRRPKC